MTKSKRATSSKRGKRDPIADKLTAAEEKFCQHYAMHQNGSEAFIAAYPERAKIATAQRRYENASHLLSRPKIKARIGVLATRVVEIAEKKFDITAERVLQELAAIAFQNAEEYFEWGSRNVVVRRRNKETGQMEPLIDENGEPLTKAEPYALIKPSETLTRVQKAAVLSVSETISKTGDRVIEAKMADKLGALKLLGQHLALFKEVKENRGTVNHTHTHTLPDLSKVSDPVEALKQFEQFRTSMHTAGNA